MKSIFVVKPDEFEIARKMEQKLLALPADSGILFVSASVLPDPLSKRDKPIYKVVIGCTREREPTLMHAIAKQFLRDLVDDERRILVEAYRGVAR